MSLRPLLGLLLLAAARASAGVVSIVPAFDAPLSPPPVVSQLRLDLAALGGAGGVPALAPSFAAPAPAWANVLAAAQIAAVVPGAAPAAAPVTGVPAPSGGAASRVEVAREVLGRFEPGEFAKLSDEKRDAALAELWDGWRARGLVSEPGGPNPDALILAGVDDKKLTSANKSVFLGVAVLGYPLEDALWLARTRIRDALDENTLHYPEGQKWRTEDHTPEFLGVSPQAQGFIDAWGAATEYARQIAVQVRSGSTVLPKSAAAKPEAAAAFARLVAELWAGGDAEAVEYLSGRDPTFTAFLLDARKPGYYLYNGEGSVVARILKAKGAAAMGIRRLEHPNEGLTIASTYLYRPQRVLDRLREIRGEPAGEHGEKEKALLEEYAARLEPLVPPRRAPAPLAPYTFADAESLPGSALVSDRNKLSAYPQPKSFQRWDLPLPAASLRARLKSGERHPSLDEARWKAVARLFKASPALASYEGELRFVSERYQTRDKLIARAPDGKGVAIQLALLDELTRLEREDPKSLPSFLRFASAAISGAL